MFVFSPEFGLFCAIIIIGWWVVHGMKSITSSSGSSYYFPERCRAILDDRCEYYTLVHDGTNVKYERAFVKCGSAENHIDSVWMIKGTFEALIIRKEYGPERVVKKENVKAQTIKQLAETIEGRFKSWDFESHLQSSRGLRYVSPPSDSPRR